MPTNTQSVVPLSTVGLPRYSVTGSPKHHRTASVLSNGATSAAQNKKMEDKKDDKEVKEVLMKGIIMLMFIFVFLYSNELSFECKNTKINADDFPVQRETKASHANAGIVDSL